MFFSNMEKSLLFTVLSVTLLASILSISTNMSTSVYAEVNQTGTENEAEIEADIEQENKCKKDTECENENELNNQLDITTTTGQQEEGTETTLTVIKQVQCTVGIGGELTECPVEITAQSFQITVEGNSPNPSEFQGSESGTVVTISAGPYTIIEADEFEGVAVAFTGDCNQNGPSSSEGTIEEGQQQTCTIENTVPIL